MRICLQLPRIRQYGAAVATEQSLGHLLLALLLFGWPAMLVVLLCAGGHHHD
jgi:hypothetical protein